jgi:predicted nucleic acid-binding protein
LGPSIWRLEIANSLQSGVRRGRIDTAYRDAALADLALLDIAADQDTDKYAWTTTLRLADRFQLRLYDAAYLERAQRRSLPLASLDRGLRSAADGLDVRLVA